ncbi:7861_t:CDS:10 [Ambispora leptoticha]|uniref:7861_t:CDS:1 n=1 Tax=Ambispora leptoticha TaxID=144679 RepID=A0A9N9AAU1_9GLOM|nr:7861_t:CDS:10 [Ambispora leptoticha]
MSVETPILSQRKIGPDSIRSHRRRRDFPSQNSEQALLRSRRNLTLQIESESERDEGMKINNIQFYSVYEICKLLLSIHDNHMKTFYILDTTKTPAEIIDDVISCIQNRSEEPATRVEKLGSLIRLIKNHERIKYTYPPEPLLRGLRFCVSDPVKEVRLAGYRALRYLVVDASRVEKVINLHYDIFMMRSLAKDPRYFNDERAQVLKLIRSFTDVPDGTKYIPLGVLRTVVSIAEQADEKLRNICVMTLAEMVIRDPKLVTQCGGMRVLLQSLVDGPLELSEYLALTILYVVDTPESRKCIRPGVDLEIVLSGFTDICSKTPKSEQQMKASSRAISILLKTWTGIIYLSMDNKQSIRSIVESLRITTDESRDAMLDMLFNIFRIKPPKWYPNFLSGRRITLYGQPSPEEENNYNNNNYDYDEVAPPSISSNSNDRLNLLDHHLVILLVIFIDSGLLEALIEIIEDKNQRVARKATLLIGEILQLSNRLLSVSRSIKIQSLPKLFNLAMKFEDEIIRHNATAALSHIDNLNRTRLGLQSNDGISEFGALGVAAAALEDRRRRSARQVENVKIKMGIQIDDVHFRNMLMETQVLAKDYTQWKWETLMELLQGPLLNPRRLEDAIRSKFLKRLIGFFRPNSYRFSNIKKAMDTQRYVRLGCTLITTLLANADGLKFLESNKFLRQIAEGLTQLDPINGTVESEPLFSKERIETTLTSGYFTMLGVFSKSKEGVKLLEKFKIFNTFYHLSELRSREDLIKTIITNLDYTLDGHPRILLSKVMTSGYKQMRLYATKHLGIILRSSTKKFSDWGIRLLITQLYDPAMEVCEMAVRVLEEICKHKENLELLVKLRPSLDHLGEVGNPLLLRFLSTSIGFRYLSEFDYVEREMDDWFQSRNQYYVTQLEVLLATALKLDGDNGKVEEDDIKMQTFDGTTPPHFYGELAKTDEGCQLLRDSGHFREFARFVKENGMERSDQSIISRLKSVLWALGNIGASKSGLPFLEEEDIIKDIVKIAQESEVLSLKGTCFFVLGLIAKTAQGVEILEELGWECVYDADTGIGTGLCVPTDPQEFLSFPKWTYNGSLSASSKNRPLMPNSPVERDLLRALTNLTNRILSSTGCKSLQKIRTKHPEIFTRLNTYLKACQMLSSYQYRLPTRRLISELFDVKYTAQVFDELDQLMAESQKVEENDDEPVEVIIEGRNNVDSTTSRNGNNHNNSLNDKLIKTKETTAGDVDAPSPLTTQKRSVFNRTHRGSDGLVAVMSDDQNDTGAEEIIPKQTLTPLIVIKGFKV